MERIARWTFVTRCLGKNPIQQTNPTKNLSNSVSSNDSTMQAQHTCTNKCNTQHTCTAVDRSTEQFRNQTAAEMHRATRQKIIRSAYYVFKKILGAGSPHAPISSSWLHTNIRFAERVIEWRTFGWAPKILPWGSTRARGRLENRCKPEWTLLQESSFFGHRWILAAPVVVAPPWKSTPSAEVHLRTKQ